MSAGKLSRSALGRLAVVQDPLPDRRAEQLQAMVVDDREGRSIIADVLIRSGLEAKTGEIDELARLRTEIREHWANATRAFVLIGRALLAIERRLPKAAFEEFIASREVLPFGKISAFKMMSVTKALDSGRFARALGTPALQPELLPPYTVAYELITLSDNHLREAAEQGLLRPDVKREDIQRFKLTKRRHTESAGLIDVTALWREQAVLQRRREVLQADLRKIESRLNEIGHLLAGCPG